MRQEGLWYNDEVQQSLGFQVANNPKHHPSSWPLTWWPNHPQHWQQHHCQQHHCQLLQWHWRSRGHSWARSSTWKRDQTNLLPFRHSMRSIWPPTWRPRSPWCQSRSPVGRMCVCWLRRSRAHCRSWKRLAGLATSNLDKLQRRWASNLNISPTQRSSKLSPRESVHNIYIYMYIVAFGPSWPTTG